MNSVDGASEVHPLLKIYCGLAPDTPDAEVKRYFDAEFPAKVEKPCGQLLWCPYGPLVEDFPLASVDKDDAGPSTPDRACMVFGHVCPVFTVAEPFADPEAVAKYLM